MLRSPVVCGTASSCSRERTEETLPSRCKQDNLATLEERVGTAPTPKGALPPQRIVSRVSCAPSDPLPPLSPPLDTLRLFRLGHAVDAYPDTPVS